MKVHRQIDCSLPSSLRFCPSLKHSPTGQYFPAMVSKVQDWMGNLLAIHRTYLLLDGSKANIDPNKMMLGTCSGGVVEISNPLNFKGLAVGEGIESCLSVAEMYPFFKVVSALSSSGMKNVELPKDFEPKNLLIIVDGDDAGDKASEVLANRASGAGWKIEFLTAPRGQDFNDVLVNQKKELVDA